MDNTRKNLVCIGDSITEGEGDNTQSGGWVGRIAIKSPYCKGELCGYRTYNLGIGGNTIIDIWHRLGEAYARNPDIIILNGGFNDIKIHNKNLVNSEPERHISNYSIEDYWVKVLNSLKNNIGNILVLGMHENLFEDEVGTKFYNSDIIRLNKFIENSCNKLDIPFLSMQGISEGLDSPKSIFCEGLGLHPNGKGYDIIAEKIYNKLSELDYI